MGGRLENPPYLNIKFKLLSNLAQANETKNIHATEIVDDTIQE